MAKRKIEMERSKKRREDKIKSVIDNLVFRAVVRNLRIILSVGPIDSDRIKRTRENWLPVVMSLALNIPPKHPDWQDFPDNDGPSQDDLWRAFAGTNDLDIIPGSRKLISLLAEMMTDQGLRVTSQFLTMALFYDFEGGEREAFIRIAPRPFKIRCWYNQMAGVQAFEDYWQRNRPQPNHIYLDVTDAELDDIQNGWDEIKELKKRVGVAPSSRGRKRGAYSPSTIQQDTEFYRLYMKIIQHRQTKGRVRPRMQRYTGIYDQIAKMYGSEKKLSENEWPSPNTVKSAIARWKKKLKKNEANSG